MFVFDDDDNEVGINILEYEYQQENMEDDNEYRKLYESNSMQCVIL
jgi:hypothetical protein